MTEKRYTICILLTLAGLGRSELPAVAQMCRSEGASTPVSIAKKFSCFYFFSAVIQFAASNEFVNPTPERC